MVVDSALQPESSTSIRSVVTNIAVNFRMKLRHPPLGREQNSRRYGIIIGSNLVSCNEFGRKAPEFHNYVISVGRSAANDAICIGSIKQRLKLLVAKKVNCFDSLKQRFKLGMIQTLTIVW